MAPGRTYKRDRRQRAIVQLQRELRIVLDVRSILRVGEVLKGIVRGNEGATIAIPFLEEGPLNICRVQLIAHMFEGVRLGL